MYSNPMRIGSHAFSLELKSGQQTHIKGVAGSCPALVAAALRERTPQGVPIVMIVPDGDTALALIEDLRTFVPDAEIFHLPTTERTPFDGVRPDRMVALSRAAALFALDRRMGDFVVTTAVGWIRRCAPRSLLEVGSLDLRLGETISLTGAADRLSAGGYTRVPIVEDPGTFAVRGDIVDLWPAGRATPLRIEVDFDRLVRVRPYDPETQVTIPEDAEGRVGETIVVPPARESVLTNASRARVREVLRSLCDACSLPSKKARNLIEDVTAGHLFVGSDAYLPALADLEPLSARIPEESPLLFVSPDEICENIDAELERALASYDAQVESPHFDLDAHYVRDGELDRSIEGRTLVCLHDLAALGRPTAGFFSITVAPPDCAAYGATDQRELAMRLKNTREQGGRHARTEKRRR
jgi:transcription-repair coupling factor (superfamily II helicase)